LASALGVSKESYFDLESHRSDLFQALPLGKVILLSRLLQIPLSTILLCETPSGSPGRLMDLAVRVTLHCSEAGLTIEQFGEQVGWDIQRFATAPATALDDWCVDTLRDVCNGVGCSWIDVLTNEAAA
jgi:hypothetical protein